MQCCPMDTYSGRLDVDDNPVPDCSCGDGCECLCLECRCGQDEEHDETSFHYMPWGEIR